MARHLPGGALAGFRFGAGALRYRLTGDLFTDPSSLVSSLHLFPLPACARVV